MNSWSKLKNLSSSTSVPQVPKARDINILASTRPYVREGETFSEIPFEPQPAFTPDELAILARAHQIRLECDAVLAHLQSCAII